MAINEKGDISATTTTSGLAWKIPGRVGDSPIIGAGCCVDNEVGAAGSTGKGEENIKISGGHTIIEMMRKGMSPKDACLEALNRVAHNYKNDKKKLATFHIFFYALNKDGVHGAASLWRNTYDRSHHATYAVHDGAEARLVDCAPLFDDEHKSEKYRRIMTKLSAKARQLFLSSVLLSYPFASMDQANVLIIGGGVIGCAIAREVSQRWQDVFLLEQFPKLGMATSTRNSGVIHSGIYYPKGSLKARHCVEGNRLTYDFCAAQRTVSKTGKLVVAANADEEPELEALLKRGEDNGVEGLRIVDPREIQARRAAHSRNRGAGRTVDRDSSPPKIWSARTRDLPPTMARTL